MAVSPALASLVERIFAIRGEEERQMAKNDPEACLASLLLEFEICCSMVFSTDKFTLEYAAFKENVEKARQFLNEQEKDRHLLGKEKKASQKLKARPPK